MVLKIVSLIPSVLFFILYASNGNAGLLKIINYYSPIFLIIHYIHLTKNTSINSDRWIPVESKFSTFYRDGRIMLIEPLELEQMGDDSTDLSRYSHKLRNLSKSVRQVRLANSNIIDFRGVSFFSTITMETYRGTSYQVTRTFTN